MKLEVKDLCFSYDGHGAGVLDSVSISIGDGELVAVLGSNGSGKSTLFKCMLGFLTPARGGVFIDGMDVRKYERRSLAARIAYIPQSFNPVFNNTVLDTVMMGFAHKTGLFSAPGRKEKDEAMDCLGKLGILHLADRGSQRISGGERQLMLLARAMVQSADIMVMDEPTASLDYGNAFMVMQTVSKLRSSGRSVIFSTHDPLQAFRYASRTVALRSGSVVADGIPEDVLSARVLGDMYGVNIAVGALNVDGIECKVCVPYEGVHE